MPLTSQKWCVFLLCFTALYCSRKKSGSPAAPLLSCPVLEEIVSQQGCLANLSGECTEAELQALIDGGGEPFDCSEEAMRADGVLGLVDCTPVNVPCMDAYRKWRSNNKNGDETACEGLAGLYDSNNDGVCESVHDGYSHCTGVCVCNGANSYAGSNCGVSVANNTQYFPAKINNWWFVANPASQPGFANTSGVSYWKYYTSQVLSPAIELGVVRHEIDMKGVRYVKSISIPSMILISSGYTDKNGVNTFDLPTPVDKIEGTETTDNKEIAFAYMRAVFQNTDGTTFERPLVEYRLDLIARKRVRRIGNASTGNIIKTVFTDLPEGAKLIKIKTASKYFDIRSDSFMPQSVNANTCVENETSCKKDCRQKPTGCVAACEATKTSCLAAPVYIQVGVTTQPSQRDALCTSGFSGTFAGYDCPGVPNQLCKPDVPNSCCGDAHVQIGEWCDEGSNNVPETNLGTDLSKCTNACNRVGCDKGDIRVNGTQVFATADRVSRGTVVTIRNTHCPVWYGNPVPSSLTCENGRFSNNGVVTCSPLVEQGNLSASNIAENNNAFFTVKLLASPSNDVSVVFQSDVAGQTTLAPTQTTFNASNFNTPQNQIITAVNDNTDDLDAHVRFSGEVRSEDPKYNGIRMANVAVNAVNIHRTSVNVTSVSASNITTEAGGTHTVHLSLSVAPSNSITITPSISKPSEASASSITLSRDVMNANMVVTGLDDFFDDGDQSYVVSFSTNSEAARFKNMTVSNVVLTNTDNDTSSLVTSCASNTTSENNTGSVLCNIRLSSMPFNNVSVTVSTNSNEANVVSGSNLSFTQSNWNGVQQYALRGNDDNFDDGDQDYSVVFSANSADALYVNAAQNTFVAMKNIDEDTSELRVTSSSNPLTTLENSISFQGNILVKLSSQPFNDVSISVVANDVGEGVANAVSSSVIRANTGDWNNGIFFNVNGVNDAYDDGDISYFFTVSANSVSNAYNGLSAKVNAINRDDDVANIVFAPNTMNVLEGGTQNIVVHVTSSPVNNVVFSLKSSSNQISFSPSTLTFNANSAPFQNQIVRVNGLVDSSVDGDQSFQILSNGVSSADALYNNKISANALVVNGQCVDVDTAGVVLSAPSKHYTGRWVSSVNAVVNAFFTARLNGKPLGNVTVNFSSSVANTVIFSPANFVFTSNNYNAPINVLITGVNDTNNGNDITYRIDAQTRAPSVYGYNGISNSIHNMVSLAQGGRYVWKDVSIGSWFACGVDTADRVLCWGDNDDGVVPPGGDKDSMGLIDSVVSVGGSTQELRWKNISAGSTHVCGLTLDNAVYCWGGTGGPAQYGQIGIGSFSGVSKPTSPVVANVAGVVYGTWKSVASSFFHTCAILDTNNSTYDQTAWCWGDNRYGQVGSNSNAFGVARPELVGDTSMKWNKIGEGGGMHTCGITTANQIKCWGYHRNGFILDAATPNGTFVKSPSDVSVIASNTTFNALQWKDISTGGWTKYSANTALGQHKYAETMYPDNFNAVSQSACGIAFTNDVYCWGYHVGDRLFIANSTGNAVLSKITNSATVSTSQASSVSLYRLSASVISPSGPLAGWGENDWCEIGVNAAVGVSKMSSPVTANNRIRADYPSESFQYKKTKQGLFASCHLNIQNGIHCFFQSDNRSNFWPSQKNSAADHALCVSNGQGDYRPIGRPNR
jgi:hypothetical protein